MNVEPTSSLVFNDHCGESQSNCWAPTPIGPKAAFVERLSAGSLLTGMDHITTSFLKETFKSSKLPLSNMRSSKNILCESLFDIIGEDSVPSRPETVLSDKLFMLAPTIQLRDTFPTVSPSSSVCTEPSSSASSKNDHWSEKFNELVHFHNRFGHCLVPNNWKENVKLSQWVKRVRHNYKLRKEGKKTSLTEEKILALEALDFTWSVQEDTWEERFNELQVFKAMHGHTNVPKNCKKHPQLAVWVKYQRRHWRLFLAGQRSSMTEERFFKLSSLDFQWNPRRRRV